jgi:hypothetical protein
MPSLSLNMQQSRTHHGAMLLLRPTLYSGSFELLPAAAAAALCLAPRLAFAVGTSLLCGCCGSSMIAMTSSAAVAAAAAAAVDCWRAVQAQFPDLLRLVEIKVLSTNCLCMLHGLIVRCKACSLACFISLDVQVSALLL